MRNSIENGQWTSAYWNGMGTLIVKAFCMALAGVSRTLDWKNYDLYLRAFSSHIIYTPE